jgi:hypothetical protein
VSRSPIERLLLTADGVVDAQGQTWPAFAPWCEAHAGMRVQLSVGADRVHSLLVPEDLPLADEAALLGYARLQFTHYFGPTAQQWLLAAWPRGVCALPGDDFATLLATAAARRVRIVSLRPSWTLAPPSDGETAVIDGDMLTLLRWQGGALVELQQRHADDAVLEELHGVRVLQAKDLLASARVGARPDFIAQPSRLRPLVWAWAATAVAACALVAVQVYAQYEEARRLQEQAAMLDRIAPVAPGRSKVADPAARGRAWAVSRQLHTDWGALWTGVERALPAGLGLNAIDLERQALRLEGEAADADAVTRLVDRLAMDAAPGEEVVLTQLQRPDVPGQNGALRFELVRRVGAAR